MPAAKRPSPMPTPPAPPPPLQPQADVIFDVEITAGTLHFVLANIGPAPAHAVRVRFSRVLRDVAGLRINDNPLFTQLEFLAPGRRVRHFIDTLAGYAQRRQPMRFEVKLDWRDDAGHPHRRTLTHDLAAWSALRETF
jgi:hypothetical protein